MSTFPASPNPQKPRLHVLSQKARGALHVRNRAPGGHRAAAPTPSSAAEPAPGPRRRTVPPALTAALVPGASIPDPPAAEPQPAAPARIPYREWKGPRPRAVGLAFGLLVVAGIISLAGGIEASRTPVPELPAALAPLEQFGVDTGNYAAALHAVTLAATLVVFGIYLLSAVLIREGRNWARIGCSVIAAAGLGAAILTGSAPQLIAVLVAIGGLGLLYRRECSRYFRPRRSQYLGAP